MNWIALIVMALVVIWLTRKTWRMAGKITRQENIIEAQEESIKAWAVAYASLDQGMEEQRECFEMDALTAKEKADEQFNTIMERNATIAELEAHLDKHDRECLPNNFDASWRPHVSTDENIDPPLYIVP